MYPFFCFISFFALYSNVRWRKVLKRTIMLLHFTFLILSKYDLPIRWALSKLESGISKFDSAQISFTFSSTSLEVSLSTDGTPSILKQSLRLYCSVSSQEAAMALFCFFNSLICSWRKLLSWQSWWILPSRLSLILLISSFKISFKISQWHHCLMLL